MSPTAVMADLRAAIEEVRALAGSAGLVAVWEPAELWNVVCWPLPTGALPEVLESVFLRALSSYYLTIINLSYRSINEVCIYIAIDIFVTFAHAIARH